VSGGFFPTGQPLPPRQAYPGKRVSGTIGNHNGGPTACRTSRSGRGKLQDEINVITGAGMSVPDQPALKFSVFDYQKVVTVSCDKFYPGGKKAVLNIGKNQILQMLY
jgi:hypothetical protein